jgi:hypothetical protein
MGGHELAPWPEKSASIDEVLIADGYVYRGYIEPKPRQHGAFQYAFRPLLPEHISAIQAEINRLNKNGEQAKAEQVILDTIARHITWNSVTGGPLTREQASRLHNPIYQTIYLQMMGAEPMGEGYDSEPSGGKGKTAPEQLEADVKN